VTGVRRSRAEVERQLSKTDSDNQSAMLQTLQDAEQRIATIRASIQAVGEKLLYVGILKSQLVRGEGGSPQIDVFRVADADTPKIHGSEDTTLMPGDVVEIMLSANGAINLPGP
jgi:polysaccharide biosynthesis/export protein